MRYWREAKQCPHTMWIIPTFILFDVLADAVPHIMWIIPAIILFDVLGYAVIKLLSLDPLIDYIMISSVLIISKKSINNCTYMLKITPKRNVHQPLYIFSKFVKNDSNLWKMILMWNLDKICDIVSLPSWKFILRLYLNKRIVLVREELKNILLREETSTRRMKNISKRTNPREKREVTHEREELKNISKKTFIKEPTHERKDKR